jgi:ABC-type Fe3+-hydroxamate transport system substrate-binding protein
MSDIYTFEDALESIITIGDLVNKSAEAKVLKTEIEIAFEKTAHQAKNENALYLIWKNPFMAVGRKTFINSMLHKGGFTNCIQAPESRYPELEIKEIITLNPDRIFLSSEPYPFKNEDKMALQLALPNSQIQFVDGELFSWYGNRMLLAADYLTKL